MSFLLLLCNANLGQVEIPAKRIVNGAVGVEVVFISVLSHEVHHVGPNVSADVHRLRRSRDWLHRSAPITAITVWVSVPAAG